MASLNSPPQWLMDDKGPMTLGLIWSFASISTLFLSLRIYCKLARKRHLWWDDYVLIVAWICSITAISLETASIPYGMGKHIWVLTPHDLEMQMLLGNITTIFAMLASSLSKTSFAITLLRLVDTSRLMKIFLWFIIITVNTFYVANILYSWLRCFPAEMLWNFTVKGTCSDINIYVNYSLFVASYSALMDFVLACLPTVVIRRLQMRLKEKIGVAIAMGMGIFGGVTAAVKAYQLGTFSDPDTSYELVSPLIWGTAEATVTIIAASIPVLRVLIKDRIDSRRQYHEKDDDMSNDPNRRVPSFVQTAQRQPTSYQSMSGNPAELDARENQRTREVETGDVDESAGRQDLFYGFYGGR